MANAVEVENKQEALYNRYRPRKFSEIIGQDFTKAALKRAISTGDLKHAYLLSGDRGCGKTTTARIIAAAVNCDYSEGGEPCGQCDVCEATFAGTFTGVVNEINAADNRGIDAIRSLISIIDLGVAYDRKVVIIDECHRLTADAWSALLKPIEEPPNNQTLWILATTDPQKIPQTILSRVSRLNFGLLDSDQLTKMVKSIIDQEKFDLTDRQVESVVWTGQGSARDTLTALERAVMGLELSTPENVIGVIAGIVDRDMVKILMALTAKDAEINYPSIAEEVLGFYERAIIAQHSPDLIGDNYRFAEQVHQVASDSHQAELTRGIVIMSEALDNLNSLGSKRGALVGALARVLEPTGSKRLGKVQDEIRELSGKMDDILVQLGSLVLDGPRSGEAETDTDDWPPAPQKRSRPQRRRDPAPDRKVEQEDPQASRRTEEAAPETESAAPRKRRRRADPDSEIDTAPDQDGPQNNTVNDIGTVSIDDEWKDLAESLSRRSKRIVEDSEVSIEDGDLVVVSEVRVPENVRRKIRDKFSALNCVFENRSG